MRVEQTQLNGVTALNDDLTGNLRQVVESGMVTHVPKGGEDYVTVLPTELWREILDVAGVKKRVRRHARAKQAERQAGRDADLDDAA